MFSERYRVSESSFGVIEETSIGSELITEAELAKMLFCQSSDVILQYANGLRAILFVVANNDYALRD
jgi:hypothetical protein